MSAAERLAIEKSVVRKLVRLAKEAGYLPTQVWDGEEYQNARNETEVLDAVFSVDDCTIHFDGGKGQNAHSHGVLIILGNGWDCISDYHCGDEAFNAVLDKVYDWCNQREVA